MADTCTHLDTIADVTPSSNGRPVAVVGDVAVAEVEVGREAGRPVHATSVVTDHGRP